MLIDAFKGKRIFFCFNTEIMRFFFVSNDMVFVIVDARLTGENYTKERLEEKSNERIP